MILVNVCDCRLRRRVRIKELSVEAKKWENNFIESQHS